MSDSLSLLVMSPDEENRRKSIAYILRRRKRGRKIGANSADVVKSWAEYGEVNFKPTGSHSGRWRWLLIPIVPLVVLAPVIIIGSAQGAEELEQLGVPPTLWALLSVLAIVLGGVCLFSSAYILMTIWRLIRRLWSHKNE